MIPLLLARIGLPLLMEAVGSALARIDNPVAKTAAKALDEVGQAVAKGAVSPEQMAEAHRHIERMQELDSLEARTALSEINATFRAEVTADDAYVRRWRPTFGYAVALTWTALMGATAVAVVATPEQAPAIIAALVNTSPIWGVALGVLGIAVVKRSQDKRLAFGKEE